MSKKRDNCNAQIKRPKKLQLSKPTFFDINTSAL